MGRYEWHRQQKEGKNFTVCGARVKPPVLGHGLVDEHPKTIVGSRNHLWLRSGFSTATSTPCFEGWVQVSVLSKALKQVRGGVCKEPLTAGNGLTQKIMKDNNKRRQEVGAW